MSYSGSLIKAVFTKCTSIFIYIILKDKCVSLYATSFKYTLTVLDINSIYVLKLHIEDTQILQWTKLSLTNALQWYQLSSTASKIISSLTVCSTACSASQQGTHQSSASLSFCKGNPPVISESTSYPVTSRFPSQRASYAEPVSMSLHYHTQLLFHMSYSWLLIKVLFPICASLISYIIYKDKCLCSYMMSLKHTLLVWDESPIHILKLCRDI